MLDPLVDLLGVSCGLFSVDVLKLDVPLRIREHVGNRTSDRQKSVLALAVHEVLQGPGHDPEVSGGRRQVETFGVRQDGKNLSRNAETLSGERRDTRTMETFDNLLLMAFYHNF